MRILFGRLALVAFVSVFLPTLALAKIAVMKTSIGEVQFKLFPERAPITVENFVGLATGTKPWKDPHNGQLRKNKPFYNGTIFHRIAPGFMIQGGDPRGNGSGGSGSTIPNERHPENVFNRPGLVAMANAGENTGSAQFFITVAPAHFLGDRYTIFGEVISGLDVVGRIVTGERLPNSERPVRPVVIKSITFRD